jgi:hypothetical protein
MILDTIPNKLSSQSYHIKTTIARFGSYHTDRTASAVIEIDAIDKQRYIFQDSLKAFIEQCNGYDNPNIDKRILSILSIDKKLKSVFYDSQTRIRVVYSIVYNNFEIILPSYAFNTLLNYIISYDHLITTIFDRHISNRLVFGTHNKQQDYLHNMQHVMNCEKTKILSQYNDLIKLYTHD